MVVSKQINPGFIKGLRIPSDDVDEVTPDWNKKLQKVFSVIERFCYKYKVPFLKYAKALDYLSEFPLKTALGFIWDDFVRVVSLRHFRQQLRSGWEYFKKGYRAYDWDSCYAMDIFLWKLKRLADILDENDRHYGDRQQSKKIREAVRLIERVIEDEYVDEFEQEVVDKYGDDIRYEACADDSQLFGFANKGKGPFKSRHVARVTLHKREKWTPENHYEIIKAERAKYRKAHNKRMREWRKALDIIEKNFFEWWD